MGEQRSAYVEVRDLSRSCTQGIEGCQLRPNLVTQLGTHPGSRESRPGASSTRYQEGQHFNKYISPGTSHPPERHHRPLQRRDKTAPGRADSKSLSSQVKPAPHSIDSKNLLECHPPQRQEHSGIDENTKEAPTDLYEPTFSSLGPTGHVNLLLDVKIISL
jgi:hypothetical protein